jgi:type I restriction enzyme, R subunit
MVLTSAWDAQAGERARQMVTSFRQFLEQHRDEITALQIFYNRPRHASLRLEDLKQLAEAIHAPPLGLSTDKLWQAYETLDPARVRQGKDSRNVKHLLTDLVALVRYTLERDQNENATLEPYCETVQQRFSAWRKEQEQMRGKPFTDEQQQWLELIRDSVASSLTIDPDDFEYEPFTQRGGLGRAYQLFGSELPTILQQLNERLAA